MDDIVRFKDGTLECFARWDTLCLWVPGDYDSIIEFDIKECEELIVVVGEMLKGLKANVAESKKGDGV
jgi:hypothetical protein